VGVPEPHRRRLFLRAGSLDNPEPTALSGLVIHRLHDSPKAMTGLAGVVANHSVNTFVSRMRGHFETDRSVLKRTVQWEEWLADAEADLALAQKLGASFEYERLERRFRFPKLCTCAGMRRRYPGHKSYSLGNLCETYDIDLKDHHRALCDARAAAQLLNLINQQRDGRPETSGIAA
jgi:Exonuclease